MGIIGLGKMKRILLVLLVSLSCSFFAHETRPVYAVGYVTMKANPSSITFPIGGSASTVINITSQGGFSGAVSLSWQAYPYQQVSVSLNTTSVTVPTGGSGFATATVSGNSTTTPASYMIDVLGSGTGFFQSTSFTTNVTAAPATVPDFRLSANITALSVAPGIATHARISLGSLAGFSGDVTLSTDAFGTNFNTTLIHLVSGRTINATLSLVGGCPWGGYIGQVQQLRVSGQSGGRLHWLDMSFVYASSPPSFCFVSDTALRIVRGSSGQTQFLFASISGFAGTVIMSAQSSLTTAFFPSNNVSVRAVMVAASAPMAVTVPPNTVPGNYTINVKGVSGMMFWAENITVQVITGTYFSMSVLPGLVSMPEGSLTTLTVLLTGQTGFNAQVDLYPYPSNRSFTFSQNPPGDLWVYDGQTTRVTLTISATHGPLQGNYALWLEATTVYLPVVNAIQIVPLRVYGPSGPSPDFSLSTKPDTLSISSGGSATTKLSLASQTGFAGTVTLSCSSSLSCSISPGSVTLSSGGNANSTLTVTTGSGASSGTYTVSVSATSNAVSHTIPVTVTVTGSWLNVTTWSIYPWLGIAAIVAATGSIIYWLYMRKKPKSP
jgi:uncharacterized membrane protein